MRYTFLMLLGLFLIGCSEEKRSMSLNESEVFFEETLASISKDHLKDNIFYIGTEDGIVYIYNSENQHLEKITTAFDRIYKIVRDSAGNYWINTSGNAVIEEYMGYIAPEHIDQKHGAFLLRPKRRLPMRKEKTWSFLYSAEIQKDPIFCI